LEDPEACRPWANIATDAPVQAQVARKATARKKHPRFIEVLVEPKLVTKSSFPELSEKLIRVPGSDVKQLIGIIGI
jgi:hypothetical protein